MFLLSASGFIEGDYPAAFIIIPVGKLISGYNYLHSEIL